MTTAVMWTGGKDSVLTLLEAQAEGVPISCLVTVRGEQSEFRAHPLPIMAMQAAAAGIEHVVLTIGEPFGERYADALASLRARGIEEIRTGDLLWPEADASFSTYWLNLACQRAGIRLRCPLANVSRADVLGLLSRHHVAAYITAVKSGVLPLSLLGTPLDASRITWFEQHARDVPGFDICGEHGEYHSLVVSCSAFTISPPAFAETVEYVGDVAYRPISVPI